MWTHRQSGHMDQRSAEDHRTSYEHDHTRVVHCAAFRRLQHKTQILRTYEGDFHRTRLTHSLEVASIGRSLSRNLFHRSQQPIIRALLPNDDLMSVICLAHDMGHPAFGHGGEAALHSIMRHHGGFESNAQTLRLLTKIEKSYSPYGLDLTRRSLLGILKYPVNYTCIVAKEDKPDYPSIQHARVPILHSIPTKAYYDMEQAEVDWLLLPFNDQDKELFQSLCKKLPEQIYAETAYCTFDCSIMNIADDIAYGVHDLEDMIHLRRIICEQFDTAELRELLYATELSGRKVNLLSQLFSKEYAQRKQAIADLVNYFITATVILTRDEDFNHDFFKYTAALLPEAKALLTYLKQFVYHHIIDSQEVRTLEYGGQMIILRLFEAIQMNPTSLLDHTNRQYYLDAPDISSAYRIVCDYIANMTDEYACRMYERLFGFNARTIFERL